MTDFFEEEEDLAELMTGDTNPVNDGIPTIAPSGVTVTVMTEGERELFEGAAAKYQEDNKLTNVTDLKDLDRILMMELLIYRWSFWVIREQDYFGAAVDLEKTQRSIVEVSKELRQVKKSLGIDKASRDRDKGESLAAFIENVRERAKEFGYKRNEESVKAITLFKELDALITFHNNCTEQERRENHCQLEDIFVWIQTVAIPEYDAIDEAFRSEQKYWVKSL